MMQSKKPPFLVVPFITFFTVVVIDFIYQRDVLFDQNWLIFFLWATTYLTAFAWSLYILPKRLVGKASDWLRSDYRFIILALLLAIITRFIFLGDYPFVTVADEIRDAGLNAFLIKEGVIKDVFGFGSYEGYGNFIPLISYFFMLLLKNSSFVYLFPSALAGIFSIFLVYLVTRTIANKKTAFFASLFLISSPLHLHYSRTELLVIMDCLLATLVVLNLILCSKYPKAFFLTGLISGLSLHFYIALRGFLLICLISLSLYVLTKAVMDILNNKASIFYTIKSIVINFLVFFFGLIVGLGPTLISIFRNNNLTEAGQHKLIFFQEDFPHTGFIDEVRFFLEKYGKAFLVYINQSAGDNHFHFNYDMPLLNFPLSLFFVAGMIFFIYEFIKKKEFGHFFLLMLIILFPITNQVIIGELGQNHRLMSIVPVLMVFAAIGFAKASRKILGEHANTFLCFFVIFYSLFLLHSYFFKRLSDYRFVSTGAKEYVFQSVINFIRDDQGFSAYNILDDEGFFRPIHYQEKIEFLTYPKKVRLVELKESLRITENNPGVNGRIALIALKRIPALDKFLSFKYEKKCTSSNFQLMPQYQCPLNKENYVFFIYSFPQKR